MCVARAADGAEEGGWVPRSDGLAEDWSGGMARVAAGRGGRRSDGLNSVDSDTVRRRPTLPASCPSAIYELDSTVLHHQLAGFLRNIFNKFKKNRKEVGVEHILFSNVGIR